MDAWRTFLYPFGFLSIIPFGGRFIIQWLQSEKAHKSVVFRSFWELSLLGNFLLLIHSFIQIQVHVCIVQACNAVISWRNLNLIQTKKAPLSFKTIVWLLTGSIIFVIFAFVVQEWFFIPESSWLRIPTAPWQNSSNQSTSFFWHAVGAIGYLLFSSRFWIQWWLAEKAHTSRLPASFWWLSVAGALLSIAYFMQIGDSVNLIGPLIGIIPYIRNLMLIHKAKNTLQES